MKIKTIKGIYESNTFILEDGGIFIIVEAGAPIEAIRQALTNNHNPSAIFLTHEHFDHVARIAAYTTAFPKCPIYLHPDTLTELQTGEINRFLGGFAGITVPTPISFENFHTLNDNQIINIGSFEIKAIFAQGHSDGSVVYLINKNLFTGDVLFDGNIGRTDLVPNGEEQMQTTLRNLQTIKFEKAYHGHGNPSTFAAQHKNITDHIK
jgi:glyoxylase-like metal-dependent hydrolase (beta-lactamase superfamily II)